jgi:hypothetical protein
MSLLPVLAVLAVLDFVVVGLLVARGRPGPVDSRWVTAGLLAGFVAWSAYAVVAEGPFGFWDLHTANAWGLQVWFDLVLALGVGWFLLQPRLRAAGLSPLPWLALITLTGSIGLLAVLLRLLLAEAATGVVPAAADESSRSHA